MKRVSLIGEDIKRLKSHKFKSLQSDLDDLFNGVQSYFNEYGVLPGDKIYEDSSVIISKVRMAITNPIRPASKACRIWLVYLKSNSVYIEALLYIAKEKNKYKTSFNLKVVHERLKDHLA